MVRDRTAIDFFIVVSLFCMRRSATVQCVAWLWCTPAYPGYVLMLTPRPENSLRYCASDGVPHSHGPAEGIRKIRKCPVHIVLDAHGALVSLFCWAVLPGAGASFYLAPATSERSPILVGLTGVLAVPLKPSMRAGAFGVSMLETSVACSKVLVFSTDAVPSALTTV